MRATFQFRGDRTEVRQVRIGQSLTGMRIRDFTIDNPWELKALVANPKWVGSHLVHAFIRKPEMEQYESIP